MFSFEDRSIVVGATSEMKVKQTFVETILNFVKFGIDSSSLCPARVQARRPRMFRMPFSDFSHQQSRDDQRTQEGPDDTCIPCVGATTRLPCTQGEIHRRTGGTLSEGGTGEH